MKRGTKDGEVKRIRLHDIRHSHAALMVELGYSIVAVAERLGDTVEVAMATYSHLYPNKMESLAADLDRASNGDLAVVPAPGTADLSALSSELENAEKEAEKI